MKQYFQLLALTLIFCTGCGAQQPSTNTLTDAVSPSAIVSGAAITPEALTAASPSVFPENTENSSASIQKMVMKTPFLLPKIMSILPMEKAFFRHLL